MVVPPENSVTPSEKDVRLARIGNRREPERQVATERKELRKLLLPPFWVRVATLTKKRPRLGIPEDEGERLGRKIKVGMRPNLSP
jgi:hypothetical protein